MINVTKMKNISKTIFIPICILQCTQKGYNIDLLKDKQKQYLYLHSNLIKVHFLPLHLHYRFAEFTIGSPSEHLKSMPP